MCKGKREREKTLWYRCRRRVNRSMNREHPGKGHAFVKIQHKVKRQHFGSVGKEKQLYNKHLFRGETKLELYLTLLPYKKCVSVLNI